MRAYINIINQQQSTDIERLISNSWPKSSRHMCGEKIIVKVDIEPAAVIETAPDITLPEHNAGGNRNVVVIDNNTPHPTPTPPPPPPPLPLRLESNESLSSRPPSISRVSSSPVIPYIDWGSQEFIDDF